MNNFSVRRNWFLVGVAASVLLTGAVVMLLHGDLNQFGQVPLFLVGALIMLTGFTFALWQKNIPLLVIGVVAVAARALLLWQAPGNDIYRYIWEGKLVAAGINPYLNAPDAPALFPLHDTIWQLVEHKTFSAIYPPLAECSFAAMVLLSPTVFFFKAVFASVDLLTGVLLWRRFGGPAALFYLWNPLMIYSFAGGGHYDSLFVLALVFGWLAWEAEERAKALLWIGSAVALKWMALPILAWAVWRATREAGLKAAIINVMVGLAPLFLSWILICLWTREWIWHLYPQNFTEYARSAEFIPRITGWFWEESRYHNSWFLLPIAALWTLVILSTKKFATAAEWTFFIAMIFSPMVHAWYFTWMLPFAVATRNKGTMLLSGSAFMYFIVYYRFNAHPSLGWNFTTTDIALLWTPFVFGFLGSYFWPPKQKLDQDENEACGARNATTLQPTFDQGS